MRAAAASRNARLKFRDRHKLNREFRDVLVYEAGIPTLKPDVRPRSSFFAPGQKGAHSGHTLAPAPVAAPRVPKLSMAPVKTVSLAGVKLWRVMHTRVPIMSAPTVEAFKVGDLMNGCVVEVAYDEKGWVKLADEFKGADGWVQIDSEKYGPLIKRTVVPQAASLWKVRHSVGLNVRSEPSKRAAVVGMRSPNSLVEVQKSQQGWALLVDEFQHGQGWCLISDGHERLLEAFKPGTGAAFTPRTFARMTAAPTGQLWQVVKCEKVVTRIFGGLGNFSRSFVRAKPRVGADVLPMEVGDGQIVESIDAVGTWLRLKEVVGSPSTGWMNTRDEKGGVLLKRLNPPPTYGLWRVAYEGGVHIRSMPHMNGHIISAAYRGSFVHADLESSGWIRLSYAFESKKHGPQVDGIGHGRSR